MSIQKNPEDEDDDDVNSKKQYQDSLNKLYNVGNPGTMAPSRQQTHRGIQDDSTRWRTDCNTGIRGIPLDES